MRKSKSKRSNIRKNNSIYISKLLPADNQIQDHSKAANVYQNHYNHECEHLHRDLTTPRSFSQAYYNPCFKDQKWETATEPTENENARGDKDKETVQSPRAEFHFLEFKGLDGFDPQSCKWHNRPLSSLSMHQDLPSVSNAVHVHSQYNFTPTPPTDQFFEFDFQNSKYDFPPPLPLLSSRSCQLTPKTTTTPSNTGKLRFPNIVPNQTDCQGGKRQGRCPNNRSKIKSESEQYRKIHERGMMINDELQFKLDRIKVFGGDRSTRQVKRQKAASKSKSLSLPHLDGLVAATCGRVIRRSASLSNHDYDDDDYDPYHYHNHNYIQEVEQSNFKLSSNGNLSTERQPNSCVKENRKIKGKQKKKEGGSPRVVLKYEQASKKKTKMKMPTLIGKIKSPRQIWNYRPHVKCNGDVISTATASLSMSTPVTLTWKGRKVKIGKDANNSLKKCGGGGYATGINTNQHQQQAVQSIQNFSPSHWGYYDYDRRGKFQSQNQNVCDLHGQGGWGCQQSSTMKNYVEPSKSKRKQKFK